MIFLFFIFFIQRIDETIEFQSFYYDGVYMQFGRKKIDLRRILLL